MLKNILYFVILFYAGFCLAGIDANRASAAELDSVKGIGPALSTRIMEERAKTPFKDWADMMSRVKGVSTGSALRLSAAGLNVNGAGFTQASPARGDPAQGSGAAGK